MPAQCTEAEWKIMELLWDHAPQTMPELTHALEESTGWTRHTVITLLKRMVEKGTVAVDESGAIKRYSPLLTREEASAGETRRLLRHVFSGKATLLVNNLVESGELDVEDLEALLSAMKQDRR